MKKIEFYREETLPFEMKLCNTVSDLSYKKHSHEEYSLGLVYQGESDFWYEGQVAFVQQQHLVFIPKQLVHACNPKKAQPWKYKMLYIQADWVEGFFESREEGLLPYPVVKEVAHPSLFKALHQQLSVLTGSACFLEKEAHLLALFESLGGGQPQESLLRYEGLQPKVKKIQEYIHSHFADKISLDQLAQISGLNKYYIIRAFNQKLSVPPHTYQNLLRIHFAKKELKKDRSVTEVAHAAGFYDQSHFHKVFKQQVGVTPEQYQN